MKGELSMKDWTWTERLGRSAFVLAASLCAFAMNVDFSKPGVTGVGDAHAESDSIRKKLPDVAERAVKSVVNISSTKTVVRGQRPGMDPLFRHFFGPGRRPPVQRGNSLGSGVLVSSDGLVLTNSHVVKEADEIAVTLASGKEMKAELVGADPKSDVAVIRLLGDLGGLEAMPLGSSEALRLGETVIAIGNPFGLGHTVTMGIVSAKGRAGMGITDYEDFIQTDAAINPGNSGGALVNMRGELVGINTAIVSRSGGYQGIGFAIPTGMAASIMKSLVDKGHVSRGWLGVGIQELSRKLADRLGLEGDVQGVLVNNVMAGTPAADAKLQAGDVITHIDGAETRSPAQLRNTIAMKGAKARVKVRLMRDGKGLTRTIVLGELEDGLANRRPTKGPSSGKTILGLRVQAIDERVRRRMDLEAGLNGLLVRGVDPGSAGAKAGLRAGDIILQADGKVVKTRRSFQSRLSKSSGDVLLKVLRSGSQLFAVLEPGAE